MVWKRLDGLLNLMGRVVCLLIFLICAYVVYDGYMVYRAAADDSLLAYKPGQDGETPEAGKIEGAVAWLTIDETPVDYPVMQGIDNAEYVNKDPYGDYSASGSIFLDCRNSADFSDAYSMIYGHHMEYGFMFGILDQYLDQTFLEEHRTGTLTVGDKVWGIELFATVEAPAEEERIFAPTEAEFPLAFIKEHAAVQIEGVQEGGRIIGLSTCKYPETSDRTIVFGFLRDSTAGGKSTF